MGHHPLFGIGITLGAYQLVLAGFEKTRWIFLQPVLASMALVVGVLLLCGLDYAEYRKSTEILGILLGPATVALAVPLYLNLRRIRQLFWPIFTTLVIGGVIATGLCVLLGWLFGAEPRMLMTMAPKSVTSPIAMLVAEQIGRGCGSLGCCLCADHWRDRGDCRSRVVDAPGRASARGPGHGPGHDRPRGGDLRGPAGK